jgi:predicted DNA-binding protein (MmcQ/YjbR family)
MQFTKRLRDGVRRGEVTCSVRIWTRPHVKPGGRYPMEEGQIEVDSIAAIELDDVTPALARASGFNGVVDLLKTAKHGRGTNVYLVRFHYVPPQGEGRSKRRATPQARPRGPAKTTGGRQRARVVRIVEQLREAKAVASGTHLSLEVRKKRFGYFLDDHHGDGRLALHCKSAPDVTDALLQLAPEQVHTPKYLGNKGWIGLWLDVPEVRWEAVEMAILEAYALVAPKSLRGLAPPGRTLTKRGIGP